MWNWAIRRSMTMRCTCRSTPRTAPPTARILPNQYYAYELVHVDKTRVGGVVGGIDYVTAVMNNIDGISDKNIFHGLSSYDQELADEIRKRMFGFENIITIDDRSM